jgi:hypothetical protein
VRFKWPRRAAMCGAHPLRFPGLFPGPRQVDVTNARSREYLCTRVLVKYFHADFRPQVANDKKRVAPNDVRTEK